jgi:molybdopterin-synthase adenylyltransferase
VAGAGIDDQTLRYSRQMILEGFGATGQKKLQAAKVLVAGAGGLGSAALYYLAAVGVGTLGIADFDGVTLSNLNRQIIHSSDDIGRPKTDSAMDQIRRLNPVLQVFKHNVRLTTDNVEEIIKDYDIVIDATDNFTSRYLISDCCYFLKKPVIEGAAVGYDGVLMTIIPDQTPCYRCLYPVPPEDGVLPTCSDTGILGMTAGIIGTAQALETVKLIVGLGETISGRILTFDALKTSFREVPWSKRQNCPLCGEEPSIHELVEYQIKCKTKEAF